MQSWDLRSIDVRPGAPEILQSVDGGRAVLLEIPAGESLQEHQVHEHAWVTVLSGQVEVTSAEQTVSGGTGLMFSFAPSERHAVHAREDTRLLLILTPWPGDGHPGAMSLADKRTVRSRAAEHRLAH